MAFRSPATRIEKRTTIVTNEFPIQCLSCGATGSVGRVTANLQCRCGSTDLDLWDGVSKTAVRPYGYAPSGFGPEEEDVPDDSVQLPEHLQHSYDTGYNRGRRGDKPLQGFFGDHKDAHDLGYEHGQRDYNHVLKTRPWGQDKIFPTKESVVAPGGTGWGKPHPAADANWSDYEGPKPGDNPYRDRKNDADASSTCPICNGTGSDPRASGGGYEENVCRNCHGTGKVTTWSNSRGSQTNDATVSSGPQLGASDNGRTAATFDTDPGGNNWHAKGVHFGTNKGDDEIKEQATKIFVRSGPKARDQFLTGVDKGKGKKKATVIVPSPTGNKAVPASTADKLMTMASAIVANNSGLSTQEAFELARRAVEAFPED